MVHEIVVLGANMGAVPFAHVLLRETIPQLSAQTSETYHVTQIAPNTHYFFKVGAPRALVDTKALPVSTISRPLADAFARYSPSQYTHVLGLATGVSGEKKSVTVKLASGEEKDFPYDSLVVATGTSYVSALWTTEHGTAAIDSALSDLHRSLPLAKTVLIAGGGPVGVETAGEIAAAYPSAQTTLLSGSTRLTPRLLPSVSNAAQNALKGLGVTVTHDLKVSGYNKLDSGATEVKLADGSVRTVDVFVDAMGGTPNTAFLPADWLTESRLATNDKTLRATAAGAAGVYGLGDAASYSKGMSYNALDGIRVVASSIAVDALAAAGGPKAGAKKAKKGELVQLSFKSGLEGTYMMPIGRKTGAGQLMGWKVPGLMVWAAKGRDYMTGMVPGAVDGSSLVKA